MRVDPDFAPPASPPPRREASPPRPPQDSVRPQQGRTAHPEKDGNDYDDGAWM